MLRDSRLWRLLVACVSVVAIVSFSLAVWQWDWKAFWANFFATIGGLVVGVPIAIWTYNINARREARERTIEGRARRDEVINLLVAALGTHVREFDKWAAMTSGGYTVVAEVELSQWETLRSDAFLLLPSLKLRTDLARQFEYAARLVAAQEGRAARILDRLGKGFYSLEGIQAHEEEVFRILREESAKLSATAAGLMSALLRCRAD